MFCLHREGKNHAGPPDVGACEQNIPPTVRFHAKYVNNRQLVEDRYISTISFISNISFIFVGRTNINDQ